MVVVLGAGAKQENERNVRQLTERVFYMAIELLGGLKQLAEYRTLTWLPSLARACYAIVLSEEYLKTEDEIAEILGITRNTVRNILRADPELALQKVKAFEELAEEEKEELRVHTAGGIARAAYEKVKSGQDAKVVTAYAHEIAEQAMQDCPVPWAYLVLKYTKGVDYPLYSAEELLKYLKDAPIKEFNVNEVVTKLQYPINTPAQLLKEIKEVIGK